MFTHLAGSLQSRVFIRSSCSLYQSEGDDHDQNDWQILTIHQSWRIIKDSFPLIMDFAKKNWSTINNPELLILWWRWWWYSDRYLCPSAASSGRFLHSCHTQNTCWRGRWRRACPSQSQCSAWLPTSRSSWPHWPPCHTDKYLRQEIS